MAHFDYKPVSAWHDGVVGEGRACGLCEGGRSGHGVVGRRGSDE